MVCSNEIELPQRRRGLLRLNHVALQQERNVVQELQRNLAVRPQHGAVDVDSLAGPQADAKARLISGPREITCAHLDEVLESCRFLQADVVCFAHDPEADRNQIGAEALRQIVLGARQILDQGRPQLAQEQQSLDSLARLRRRAACASRSRLMQCSSAWRSRSRDALRRILQNLRIGNLYIRLPSIC